MQRTTNFYLLFVTLLGAFVGLTIPAFVVPTTLIEPTRVPSGITSHPIGVLTAASNISFTGWACDPLRPSTNLTVTIFIDGVIIANVIADQTGDHAIALRCGGNSNHAFAYPVGDIIRATFRNGTHRVDAEALPVLVFGVGSPVPLTGSPKLFVL